MVIFITSQGDIGGLLIQSPTLFRTPPEPSQSRNEYPRLKASTKLGQSLTACSDEPTNARSFTSAVLSWRDTRAHSGSVAAVACMHVFASEAAS